jgi:hypothetical protein
MTATNIIPDRVPASHLIIPDRVTASHLVIPDEAPASNFVIPDGASAEFRNLVKRHSVISKKR